MRGVGVGGGDRGDPIAAWLGFDSSHRLIGVRLGNALAWGARG